MDRNMKKSILIRVVLVLALVGAYLFVSNLNNPSGNQGNKTVTLEIFNIDEENVFKE